MNEKLSSNMEMYLKTILRLEQDESPVRVKSIADSLGVTMPSVSEALRNLKTRGLVDHSSYGGVKLSDDGRNLASGIDKRFELLTRFLTDILLVEGKIAEKEACEIEHVVGENTLLRMVAYLDWMTNHREELEDCLRRFHKHLQRLIDRGMMGDNGFLPEDWMDALEESSTDARSDSA